MINLQVLFRLSSLQGLSLQSSNNPNWITGILRMQKPVMTKAAIKRV
jgi:hypothetical protein